MRLEIKNLCKTYKKGVVKALDDFSVTLVPALYPVFSRWFSRISCRAYYPAF